MTELQIGALDNS